VLSVQKRAAFTCRTVPCGIYHFLIRRHSLASNKSCRKRTALQQTSNKSVNHSKSIRRDRLTVCSRRRRATQLRSVLPPLPPCDLNFRFVVIVNCACSSRCVECSRRQMDEKSMTGACGDINKAQKAYTVPTFLLYRI